MCGYPRRPEEGFRSSGTVVIGCCELPDMGAEN